MGRVQRGHGGQIWMGMKRTLFAIAIGFSGFIFYPYSNFIWFKNPDIVAHMIDAIVPFALVGLLNHLFTPTS